MPERRNHDAHGKQEPASLWVRRSYEKSELSLDNPDGIKYNKDKESIPIGGRSQGLSS